LRITEHIETVELSLDDALAAIKSGEIRDAKTLATVLYWAQFVA
jgi:exonuclease VII small subunit